MPIRFEPSVERRRERRERRERSGRGGRHDPRAVSTAGHPPSGSEPTLRLALVNNMPDAAFDDTERQFLDLLEAGSADWTVVVDGYVLPGRGQGGVARGYRPVERLYERPPDGLIVTGTEPRRASLPAEPYWEALADLLRWADGAVPSMLLSCLAAHAALLVLDGVERTALDSKRSGVFAQAVDHRHRLMRGMDDLPLPHSRYNDVPAATLAAHGYALLASSPDVGWSVAARDDGACLVVLAQGHPEYSPDTLLREYRRDVRRFLQGTTAVYPALPGGYLDRAGEGLLEAFAGQAAAVMDAAGAPGAVSLMEAFPFDEAARHVRGGWRPSAERIVANWLEEIATRTRASVLR